MTGTAWLRRWLVSRVPARGWADDCPAGLPVPESNDCDGCDSVWLATLAPGQSGCVTCLREPGGALAATLAALGVLPGIEVQVVQRFPAFVLRLGHAEIAVDETLAAMVRVRKV